MLKVEEIVHKIISFIDNDIVLTDYSVYCPLDDFILNKEDLTDFLNDKIFEVQVRYKDNIPFLYLYRDQFGYSIDPEKLRYKEEYLVFLNGLETEIRNRKLNEFLS